MIGFRLRWGLLLTASLASAGIWWASITRLSWLPAYYQMPHLDTPKLLGESASSFDGFAVLAASQMLLYILVWVLARPLRSGRAALAIVALALPSAVTLWMAYPAGAGDVYAYVAEADLVLRYASNPFYVPVGQFPDSPLLPFLDFPNETTHYGPLWLVIGLVLRLLSGGQLLTAILLFKVAATLLLGLTAYASYLAVRARRPAEAIPAAALVAWNPLMLFEFAGNAHNDVAMSTLVAAAFYLQAKNWGRAAVFALVAACLVKYVAVVIVPLFLIAILRDSVDIRQWLPKVARDAAILGLLGLLLSTIAGSDGTLGVLQRMTTWFTTSPGAVLYYYLLKTMTVADATRYTGEVARAVYVACYAIILLCLWLRFCSLVTASVTATITLMLIQTVWFQPWYVAWALPIAAIMASGPGAGLVFGMSAGGFGIHLVMGFGWRLWWVAEDKMLLHARGALAMWLPAIGGLALGKAPAIARRRFDVLREQRRNPLTGLGSGHR